MNTVRGKGKKNRSKGKETGSPRGAQPILYCFHKRIIWSMNCDLRAGKRVSFHCCLLTSITCTGAVRSEGPTEAAVLNMVLLDNELATSPRNGLPLPGNCS